MTRVMFATGAAALLVAACVTINVYFPAAEAQEAADKVIGNVWGSDKPADTGRLEGPAHSLQRFAQSLSALLVRPAQAQPVNIDVSSPGVRRIEASMQQRHDSALLPYWTSGAIGLTEDAMVAVRDQSAVPLPERNALRKLVADENADRSALYREIAVANGHPEWESKIRETFAERWIANARGGWYFRDSSGTWRRK